MRSLAWHMSQMIIRSTMMLVNEKGLGMAGLNFVGNAVYAEPEEGKQNVAQYEFIPWLLSQCATLDEASKQAF